MSAQLRLKNYMAEAAEKYWEKNVESKQVKPLKLHCFAKAEDCFKHCALETNLPFDTPPLILPQSF